ncbi:OB-fold domain-containing protein [Nocardia aurea]|uniref:OB-fold domain-containing protein n=1 Tax=Nocardia aurea TaxID=2144174 RepID=UPI000D6955CE|nr:OB-fold domain-containing protein [Nocardia aurea]
MTQLLGYGAYLPYNRLRRDAIGAALGGGGGRGHRTVASYDEDTTSMGVEAARIALRTNPGSSLPARLYFATATPAYMEKTNATVIHTALGLDTSALAVDMAGSVRSGVGAMIAAMEAPEPALVVTSDVRTGLPGSADERDGGDGAAALLFGDSHDGAAIADVLAVGSATGEFLERWRDPDAPNSQVWEERFGEHAYQPLARAAFDDALKRAEITAADIDVLVIAGLPARAARRFGSESGVSKEAIADNLAGNVGNTGTAHPGIMLADVLDQVGPDTTIALVVLADGATTFILRTTAALPLHRSSRPVQAQLAAGNDTLRYTNFLTWRNMLRQEPPRRPDPDRPAAPPSHRRADYKFGFVGSRCTECDTVHVPPGRVCATCHTLDRMTPHPMADAAGRITAFVVDHLVFTPQPPAVLAVVDFVGGGRFRCQLADVDPKTVSVGDAVEMTFRKILTANGVHNYFWKARPVPTTESAR